MSGLVSRVPVQGTVGKLSAKVQAVYDRMLLERAVQNQVFDLGAQRRIIPAKSNAKKGFARRYKGLLPATTPLAEYNGSNIKSPNKIVVEEVEYSVAHYGDYVTYTDELDLYEFDNIKTVYMELLGDQASLTVDTIRRNTLRGGSNVIYANGAVSRTAVADGSKKITLDDLKLMKIKLVKQGAKKFTSIIPASVKVGTLPVRPCYIGICSPEVIEDLRELKGWKDVETYSDSSKAMPFEAGSIEDFRIIQSDNNDPIANQGTAKDTNVYLSYFMGKDAYATTSLRGKEGIISKVKPLGSSGSEDPLDQYGTIGWKAIFGCDILNEAWLVRVESTASIEDESQRHFLDSSV